MRSQRRSPDFSIILITLLLLSIGIIMVFSASAYSAYLTYGDAYYYLKRQLTWALLGIIAMVTAMQFDYRRFQVYAKPILLLSFVLLVLVLIVGATRGGASRWIGFGSVSFQPSELIKLTMVIYMAHSLSEYRERLKSFWRGVLPHLLIPGLACALILAQPDLGTAVAIAGTTYLLLMAAGARGSHLTILALAGVALVVLAIIVEPYRMQRILAFLNPRKDPTGAGFQTIQALLALGSGGLLGLGLGNGKQKLLYIPERHTDFIYAIIGEELGFIGASIVLILFFLLVWRGFKAAVSAPDNFGSLLGVGLTVMIALQSIINIGVVTGSLPVTGITLPLLSYGGSSLLFTLTGIGILLNVSRFTTSR